MATQIHDLVILATLPGDKTLHSNLKWSNTLLELLNRANWRLQQDHPLIHIVCLGANLTCRTQFLLDGIGVVFHSYYRWIKETMSRTSIGGFSFLFAMRVNALPMCIKVLRNSRRSMTVRN